MSESEHAANAKVEQRRLIEPLHYPDDVARDVAEEAVDFVWLETFPLPILRGKHRRHIAAELAAIVGAIRDGVTTRNF